MGINNQKYKYNSVLLIDDNEIDNFINKKMLETNYFSKNIYTTLNGKMALEFINDVIRSNGTGEGNFPDLIIVDLNMPVMNGFEFIENVKKIKSEKLSNCKIAILTSSIYNEDRVKAEKIDDTIVFVNKPLTNELIKSL